MDGSLENNVAPFNKCRKVIFLDASPKNYLGYWIIT